MKLELKMVMKISLNFLTVLFLILCPAYAAAQRGKTESGSLEEKIRRLDFAQAQAILRKDFKALDELCAKDFTTNNPRGEISKGLESVKELIRIGVIDYASFVREIESVMIHGKTVIVMGSETITPNPKATQVGQTVRRRYTNIWMKRNGKWLLTARHASLIPE